MKAYLDLLRTVLETGEDRDDRTGVGTRGIFGYQMRFDLRAGFPLLTTKKLHLRSIIYELLWFLRGDTRVDYLREHNVTIWDEWATPEQCAKFGRPAGDLGPVYGHQWRNFGATRRHDGSYAHDGVDQIAQLLAQIRQNPSSRRLIVTGWNPAEAEQVELPPCHTLFQFYVQNGALSCQLYQRSADIFLGVPFNIASYALLTLMIAHVCEPRARRLRAHVRRRAPVQKPLRAGAPAARARAARAAAHAPQSGGARPVRVPLRRLQARGLRPAPAHQGRGRGLK